LEELGASIFMVKQSEKSSFSSGQLVLEDVGSTLLRNFKNDLTVSIA
jgi:hypothetical protein